MYEHNIIKESFEKKNESKWLNLDLLICSHIMTQKGVTFTV